MMRQTTIEKLCDAINAARGLQYPAIGYLYYANITGDGRTHRTVYAIINEGGGVTAVHNAHTTRATAQNLRAVLAATQ